MAKRAADFLINLSAIPSSASFKQNQTESWVRRDSPPRTRRS